MKKSKKIAGVVVTAIASMTVAYLGFKRKITGKQGKEKKIQQNEKKQSAGHKQGFYERYVKRIFDIVCGVAAVTVFLVAVFDCGDTREGKAWKSSFVYTRTSGKR